MDLGQSLQQPLTLCAQDSIFVCKPQTSNRVLTILYAHITGNSLALKSSFHVSASGPRSGLVLVTLIRDVYLKSIFKYFFFDVFVFVFEEFFEKVFLFVFVFVYRKNSNFKYKYILFQKIKFIWSLFLTI